MSLSKPRGKQPARTKQPPTGTGNPALDLFHRHWLALEKQQAKLDKQALESRALYQRFSDEIEPLERQQCDLIFALAQRLVGFCARKSFTQWQREMLHNWIHQLIEYLESNPFRAEMDLESLYMQIQANTAQHMDDDMLEQQCDFITHLLMETCGHCPEDIETLREMVKNPDLLRNYLDNAARQDMAGDREDDEEDTPLDEEEWAGPFDQEDPFEQAPPDAYARARASREQEEAKRLEHLFSKSTLKQLYRKLALALHPDRETDPAKQAEKTRIMGQLSQAWENKEMFTVLQLAHTHLPEVENLLSEDNLAYLNPLLKRRLRELELVFYRGPDGLMGAVLRKFKLSSRKKTEQAFADHLDYLLRDIRDLTGQLAQITTLQTLKPHLAARWETQQQAMWLSEPDLDWMFR